MRVTIEKALKKTDESVIVAIDASEGLALTTSLPQIILLAESSGLRPVRNRASQAVLKVVEQLGADARADRDQSTIRGPVTARLADSIRRFSMHRNDQLVDAFLLAAAIREAPAWVPQFRLPSEKILVPLSPNSTMGLAGSDLASPPSGPTT